MKKLHTTWTFTPGAAGVGTVVLTSATYTLNQILLITNTTTGAVIYQFNDPAKGATLSTGSGNTTLTLDFDTTGQGSGDILQIWVDDSKTQTELLQDWVITGAASQSTLGNNVLLATAGSGAFDAKSQTTGISYRSFYCQIIASAGISAGAIIFETSNNGTNWTPLEITEHSVFTGAIITTAQTIAASTNRFFSGAIPHRYIQCRISTAFVGGTIQAITTFSTTPYQRLFVQALQPTAANLATNANINAIGGTSAGALVMAAGTNRGLPVAFAAPASNTDRASSAITTSTNTGTIADDFGQAISALINVSASSGTTPTLDLVLQESYDNGTNWQDIYHLPRITGTGTFPVPPLVIAGRRRWSWTVGGTTPSFTTLITAMRQNTAKVIRNFFDRTLNSTQTLNATTATFNIEGCTTVTLSISSGAATTPCAIQLQYSPDGTNWMNASAILTSAANTTSAVASTQGLVGRFARAIVTTAGSSQTLNYIQISGVG